MNSRRRNVFVILLVAIFAFLANDVCVMARTPNANSDEWQVESDQLTEITQNGKTILYHQGKVAAKFKEYRINADRLTLYLDDKKVVAEGNVVFAKIDQKLNCHSLEFFYGNGPMKVILTLTND